MPAGDAPVWVLVCGGFHQDGGMDRANAALAGFLAARNARVHLVTHRVEGPLASHPRVHVSLVPRRGGWYFASDLTLDRRARAVVADLARGGARAIVVANGANCTIGDVNWVHSVHHAWPCRDEGAPAWFRIKNRAVKRWGMARERRTLREAHVVIANSSRTNADVVSLLDVGSERVHTVYPGSADAWRPPSPDARETARRAWLRDPARPLVAFVGALGHDVNKGIDRLLPAWERLCSTGWQGELVVAGGGSRAKWERLAAGAACPVTFTGHTSRVAELLDAADLLVSPVRYEAYGLAVHEALCRGVPAIVSARAGIVERLSPELSPLVLRDPEDIGGLVACMRVWARDVEGWRTRARGASAALRAWREQDMAARIVALAEDALPSSVLAHDVRLQMDRVS